MVRFRWSSSDGQVPMVRFRRWSGFDGQVASFTVKVAKGGNGRSVQTGSHHITNRQGSKRAGQNKLCIMRLVYL